MALVLLAQPHRRNENAALMARNADVVRGLSYQDVDWVRWPNDSEGGGKYGPHARARNDFIQQYLQDDHEWVLWLDVDIVNAPTFLVETLIAVATARRAIVAPMVWVERIGGSVADTASGGWFYDIGGFLKNGTGPDLWRGVPGREAIVEMDSVGCCYIAPAQLYRDGLTYPGGAEVEHVGFCREARKRGVPVLALRDLNIEHAYLPAWGEGWH